MLTTAVSLQRAAAGGQQSSSGKGADRQAAMGDSSQVANFGDLRLTPQTCLTYTDQRLDFDLRRMTRKDLTCLEFVFVLE